MNFISKLLAFLVLISIFTFGCEPPQKDEPKVEYRHNDNTVRVRLPSDARFMNPGYMRGYEQYILIQIFPMLMDFDPETSELKPIMVKSAPVVAAITEGENAGGQSFTYEIHDEAIWDDGKPVTGHDYAFTIKAIFNPKVPSDHIRAFLNHIYDVKVDETNPKKFTVFSRGKYILAEGSISNSPIMPAHIYDPTELMKEFSIQDLTEVTTAKVLADNKKIAQFAEQFTSRKYNRETVSGAGAYKFVEWIDKQRIILAKKKNWWGDQLAAKYPMLRAYPDTIIYLPIRDDNAVIAAIKDEDLDVCASINSNLFNELKENDVIKERFNFASPSTYNFFYTILNSKSPKLADKRVRRALAHLLDLDKLIEIVYGGYGEKLAHPFPPDASYYRKDLPPIDYNLEKAANLLDEAGWKDNDNDGVRDKIVDGEKVDLKLTYLASGTLFAKNYSAALADNARKVGIEITMDEQSFTKIIREILPARDFEMTGLQGAADPLAALDPYQLWHTDNDTPSGSNRAGFGTPETDALIEKIRTTTDIETRNQLFSQFQEIIYEEQPWLILFTPKERAVIHKRFEGKAYRTRLVVPPHLLKLKE